MNRLCIFGAVCFLFSLAIYGIAVTKAMVTLAASEEPLLPYAAEALHSRGTYDIYWGLTRPSANDRTAQTPRRYHCHPPTYVYLVSKLGHFFGDYVFGARVLALFCVASTAMLLLLQSYLVFEGCRQRLFWTWITGALYLANPVAIKSSIVIDSDASIFTLSFAAFTLAWILLLKKRNLLSLALVGIAWLACLFAKLTMAALIPLACLVFFAIDAKRFSIRWVVLLSMISIACLVAFKHLLGLMDFPIKPLLDYISGTFGFYTVGRPITETLHRFLMSFIYTCFWMGPALIFLFFAAARLKFLDSTGNKRDPITDFLGIVTILFVFGHVLVGGTYNRFPRFMTPGLPGLCLLGVWVVARTADDRIRDLGKKMTMFIVLGVCILWYWLVTGDYLYTVIYVPMALKRGLMPESPPTLLLLGILQIGAYLMPFLAIAWLRSLVPLKHTGILLIVLASFIGIDIRQVQAAYDTYFNYGQRGREEILARVNLVPADRSIMAPYSFVYYRGDGSSTFHYEKDWYDDQIFLEAVSNPRMQAIVYTPMDFPVERACELQSPKIVSSLRGLGYKQNQIGDYLLWVRD